MRLGSIIGLGALGAGLALAVWQTLRYRRSQGAPQPLCQFDEERWNRFFTARSMGYQRLFQLAKPGTPGIKDPKVGEGGQLRVLGSTETPGDDLRPDANREFATSAARLDGNASVQSPHYYEFYRHIGATDDRLSWLEAAEGFLGKQVKSPWIRIAGPSFEMTYRVEEDEDGGARDRKSLIVEGSNITFRSAPSQGGQTDTTYDLAGLRGYSNRDEPMAPGLKTFCNGPIPVGDLIPEPDSSDLSVAGALRLLGDFRVEYLHTNAGHITWQDTARLAGVKESLERTNKIVKALREISCEKNL